MSFDAFKKFTKTFDVPLDRLSHGWNIEEDSIMHFCNNRDERIDLDIENSMSKSYVNAYESTRNMR